MLAGNRLSFAVEWKVNETAGKDIFENFFFWIKNQKIGDPDDCYVVLSAVRNWVEDFVQSPRDRFEEGLIDLPRHDAYRTLASSVLVEEESDDFIEERYANTYSRFHITHLGMSSFHQIVLFLILQKGGPARFVWSDKNRLVHDAYVQSDDIDSALKQFLSEFSSRT